VKKLIAATSVIAGLAGVAVLGRRVGRLRLARGRAALQLVIRGGLRYAGSAPRLFAATSPCRPPRMWPPPWAP
jgi:hypothetical protein